MNKIKGLKPGDYLGITMKRTNFWELSPTLGKFEMARQFCMYRSKAAFFSKLLFHVYESSFSI